MNETNLFAQFVELKQICKTGGRGKDVRNIWEAHTEEIKDIVGVKRNPYDLLRAVVALNPIELALRLYNALQDLFANKALEKNKTVFSEFQASGFPVEQSSQEEIRSKKFSEKVQEIHMHEAKICFYTAYFDGILSFRHIP